MTQRFINYFEVSAFATNVFTGNPAGVCTLDKWLPNNVMQNIAMQNNLSETAFVVATENAYSIRWFTPGFEIDLAGHPTLATAHVLFNEQHLLNGKFQQNSKELIFNSKSGDLMVRKNEELLTMVLPSREGEVYTELSLYNYFRTEFGINCKQIFLSRDLMLVLDSYEEFINFKISFDILKTLPGLGLIITLNGKFYKESNYDCVSRCFYPDESILEDPVTGSAHCTIVPYWSKTLEKQHIHAYQASKRGGELFCHVVEDKVCLSGKSLTYLRGQIEINCNFHTTF